MAVRLNSEKKIDNPDFKLKIGTTNKLNPQVIYIEGRGFISPTEERESYERDLYEIKHTFNKTIGNNIKKYGIFENNYILDFQIATSGIKIDKKSFMSFQFLLKQANRVEKLKDIKVHASDMINDIVYSLSEDINKHHYLITKTKK